MALKKFLMIGVVATLLVACGDDSGSNSVTDSDEVSSSSVCKNCNGSSSSKVKSSSSSRKKGDAGTESGMTSSSAKSSSSSSVDSSSSSVMSSSSSDGSSSSSAMSSSSDASSSCSSVKSSSSLAKSSSSVAYVEPCRTDSVDTCEYGTLTDERDGQTYKTVKIGDQVWMAENLNYAYTAVPYHYNFLASQYTSDSTSWCYDNDASNCAKYGRLYTWAAAMDSVGTWSENGKGCGYDTKCTPTYPVRGICPEGWHLPTQVEWDTLFATVGGQSTAGTMLKSTSGWDGGGNGTDVYSFSALPAGLRYSNGEFDSKSSAYFWSSTGFNSDIAYKLFLYDRSGDAYLICDYKYYGFSVRCVKD